MVEVTSPTTTTTTTTTTTEAPKATRYFLWSLVAFCSIVALMGQLTQLNRHLHTYESELRWAASVMAISFIFSLTAVLAHHVEVGGRQFSGTIVEGILAVIVFGFWAAGLSTIMDPRHGSATQVVNGVEGDVVITSGNVYFASWFALIASLLILIHYVKYQHNFSPSHRADARVRVWAVLALASFVVMASEVRQYKLYECGTDRGSINCSRLTFGMVVGIISGVLATIWSFASAEKATDRETLIISSLLFILWIFVVCFSTFGENATAASPGNIFFFSWLAFMLSTYLVGDGLTKVKAMVNLKHRLATRGKKTEADKNQDATDKEATENKDEPYDGNTGMKTVALDEESP